MIFIMYLTHKSQLNSFFITFPQYFSTIYEQKMFLTNAFGHFFRVPINHYYTFLIVISFTYYVVL